MSHRILSAGAAALLVLFPLRSSPAQALYMPRDVKAAFRKGTRSPDGRPGPNYWQNRAKYDIDLTASPPDRTIRGSETITYYNASPDTLHTLVFKLFVNIHKPGAPRIGGAGADYLTSGTHIDAFAVNGRPTAWEDNPRYFTWQPVQLAAPVAPHDSVHLSITWHYEISREANREGMIDSTTYFLAYTYPRVAVYDDYNGWDTMDFTDQQEFYSDFNDYDVAVHVPANFLVWGTGTLLNPADVLQPAALQRYMSSLSSDQPVRIATKQDLAAKRVTTRGPTNTWRFRARNVPDVTFGVSDHYDWDAAGVIVDDSTRRRASVNAAYNDTAVDYHHMVGFARHALDWLSHKWPGVPYPYEKTTVFQGPAGMEYPMMANDESYPDTNFSRFVAEHEIAHTYMPFYMGINETRYGFMDEGWATTFEYLIGTADLGKAKADSFFKQFRVAGWINDKSSLEDLPIITPEDMLKNAAYGNNAYGKAALGYLAVKELLGDHAFRAALHEYMRRWNGKHPTPWDFFNTFNDATGRNLDWFWNDWYFSNSYIDLAVESVTTGRGGSAVAVDNLGGMPAPFDLRVVYGDGTSTVLHQTPAVWQTNRRRATIYVNTRKSIASVTIDGGIWMDADTTNNTWKAP